MSDTETPPAVTEVWAYAGRRVCSDGTIGYAWAEQAGAGEEHLFSKNPKAVIGYLYERQVIRFPEEPDRLSVAGEPRIVGESWNGGAAERIAARRPEWNVKDQHAASHMARKRLQNAAAKAETDLDALIKPLLEVAKQLRTGAERDAMTAYVIRRMSQVWYMAGKSGVGS